METATIQVPQYTQQTFTMMPMGMLPPVSSYKSSAPPTDQGLAYQTTTDDAISA